MELRDEEYRSKGIRAPRQQIWVPTARSENLKKAILINETPVSSSQGCRPRRAKAALKKDWENPEF